MQFNVLFVPRKANISQFHIKLKSENFINIQLESSLPFFKQVKAHILELTESNFKFLMSNTSASNPGWSEGGGGKNMKYKAPRMAAIFFMTSFNRDRGGHGPLGSPPGSAAALSNIVL